MARGADLAIRASFVASRGRADYLRCSIATYWRSVGPV
jgi:hypothetical protein